MLYKHVLSGAVVGIVGIWLPVTAWAQAASGGGIAGVARDTTGAVLPGVTVEAASPALIEKVRTVVTDDQGQYKIVDLRPGVYSVTFTLTGFAPVKREGVELTTGFTATVNAEMKVGALEETVTVTGASPVVDTQNVRTQNVLTRQVLEGLPTNKTLSAFAALTVGASLSSCCGAAQDVGGNRGESYAEMVIHGGRTGDGQQMIDGMKYNNELSTGGGSARYMRPSETFLQEITLTTSGFSAEYLTGGVQENGVPRDGGNRFSLYSAISGTSGDLQSDNLTNELRARGLTAAGRLRKMYDVGVGVGGPIARDRLWFYTAHRYWDSSEYLTGIFYSLTPNTVGPYVPDLSRPAFNSYPHEDHSGRLTWQMTSKQKIATNQIFQSNCQCAVRPGPVFAAGEALVDVYFPDQYLGQATWSYPRTNRLLFEAGVTVHQSYLATQSVQGVSRDAISIVEFSNGLLYNNLRFGITSGALADPPDDFGQRNGRVSMSYVTGSHAFKGGFQMHLGHNYQRNHFVPLNPQGYPVYYSFLNGRPVQVVQLASPAANLANANQYALYAQDQWTLRNLTLNLGVRWDRIHGYIPEQDRPGGVFVPAFHIDRIENIPNFTDVDARIGAAYDVFGNGKTALKVNVGRYLASLGAGFPSSLNPAYALVAQSTRTWNDANNNFLPDCDLTNRGANGECGALDNQAFGTVRPNVTWDKSVTEGFGNRPHNWQFSASVQQELGPGLAANVGYFRTWFGNFTVIDNVRVTPADFTTFCMPGPSDPRLPNGGGALLCDLGDVVPSKFGQVQNVVTKASNFGDPKEVYDGVDATMNWRFGRGGLLMGGMNVGRKVTQCVAPDGPVQFCRQVEPWLTQVKFSGSYPLPWGLALSGVLQNLAGIQIATPTFGVPGGTMVFTNAQVRPSLGRDLAQGPNGVLRVQLYGPTEAYEDRLTQLDVRVSKVVMLRRVQLQPKVDLYNVFNAAPVLVTTSTYPRNYLLPQQILGGRLLKFSVQVDY